MFLTVFLTFLNKEPLYCILLFPFNSIKLLYPKYRGLFWVERDYTIRAYSALTILPINFIFILAISCKPSFNLNHHHYFLIFILQFIKLHIFGLQQFIITLVKLNALFRKQLSFSIIVIYI